MLCVVVSVYNQMYIISSVQYLFTEFSTNFTIKRESQYTGEVNFGKKKIK
jgi:hypothetical protein